MSPVHSITLKKDTYHVALSDPSTSPFNFNLAYFASKIFSVTANKLLTPSSLRDLLGLTEGGDIDTAKVLLTQLISCDPKEAGDPPFFGVLCRHKTEVLVHPVTLVADVNLQVDLAEVESVSEFVEEN